MKNLPRSIIFFILIYVLSVSLLIWGWTSLAYINPETKMQLNKASISKMDIALALVGKSISEEKNNSFKKITGEQFNTNKKLHNLTIFGRLVYYPAVVLAIIIFVPYLLIRNLIQNKIQAKQEQILKAEYINKYNIGQNRIYVRCIDSKTINEKLMYKNLVVWMENNRINIINDNYKEDIGLFNVNYEDILCFLRYGDIYSTTKISGGDTSFGKALLGFMVAGEVGAILASCKPITGNTIVHDKRETLLVLRTGEQEGYIFFEPKFYDFLMHAMPNKEVNYLQTVESNNKVDVKEKEDKYEKLIKLGEMKEKGLINDDEFIELKKQLIG